MPSAVQNPYRLGQPAKIKKPGLSGTVDKALSTPPLFLWPLGRATGRVPWDLFFARCMEYLGPILLSDCQIAF